MKIPLSAIAHSRPRRALSAGAIRRLAESFTADGQLQPIVVVAERDGRYRLVCGRHRLEAARRLDWTEIEATVTDLSAVAEDSARAAENVCRQKLTPAELILALKAMAAHRDPAAHRAPCASAGDEAEQTGSSPVAARDHFAVVAAERIGRSASQVRRLLQAGRDLTEEQLGVLAEREATVSEIRAINDLEPERQAETVALVASGLPAKDALAHATQPAQDASETIPGVPVRTEEEMDDAEWVETFCGETLARLQASPAVADLYTADAILWRRARAARNSARTLVKAARKERAGKYGGLGAFGRTLSRLANLDHPRNWQPCGPCVAIGGACQVCRGDGYLTAPTPPRTR